MPTQPQPPLAEPSSQRLIRSLAAARYLLGARGSQLVEDIDSLTTPQRQILQECRRKLTDGEREDRAKFLARQVTRLLRSLQEQKLR